MIHKGANMAKQGAKKPRRDPSREPRLVESLNQYGTELQEILTADDVRTVATMVVRRAKMGELDAQEIVMRTAASLAIGVEPDQWGEQWAAAGGVTG